MTMSSITTVGWRTVRVAALVSLILSVGTRAADAQTDPVYDTNGFHKERALLSLLPFEHFDTVTGNMILSFTDLTLPGNAGFDVSFVRTFNTRLGEWRFGIAGIPMYLISDPPDPSQLTAVTFFTADGAGHRAEVGGGPNTLLTKEFWLFDRVAHTLSMPNGLVATYNDVVAGYTYYLSEVRDPFGNTVTFQWNGLGGLQTVTQSLGTNAPREVSFQGWNNFHLDSMSYLGRTWNYTWDANPALYNDLRTVTPPAGGTWQYRYTNFSGPFGPWHSMDQVTTPNGGTITYGISQVQIERPYPLNTVNPWVVSSRTTGGRAPAGVWTFSYTGQSTDVDTPATPPTPSTRLHFEWQDHFGQAVQWKRSVSVGSTTYEDEETLYGDVWFGNLRVPVITSQTLDRDGRVFTTTYTYSPNNNGDWGHPSTIVEAGELSRTTNITYRHSFSPNYIRGRVESVSADGFTRSYAYDNETGFLTSQTIFGVPTNFAPTGEGNVATATDANGEPTSFTYEWGVLKNSTRPIDPITRSINPDGTVATESVGNSTTTFSYDVIGRITSASTNTSGREPVTTTYNLSGGVWDYTTVTHGSSSVSTDLDGFGQPTGTLDSAGVRTSTTYNALGRVSARTYPFIGASGPEETYIYDPLGRLVRVDLPEDGRVTYDYLWGGAEVRIHERNFGNDAWRTTTQTWQAFGDSSDARLALLVDANDKPWTYFYNGLGQLTKVVMPGGKERTWTYDGRGFLTGETHPESGATQYGHDAIGNVTSKETPAGPIAYVYDAINRLRRINPPGDADDVTIDYTSSARITRTPLVDSTFTYDSANRLIQREDLLKQIGSGVTVQHQYSYDGSDNLTEITDHLTGRRVVYDYGSEHRLTRVRTAVGQAPLQDVIWGVGYHPSGAISAYNFANGRSLSVSFDGRYRPQVWANGPLNVTLGYDQIGNVSGVTDNSGLGNSATYAYDRLDRLTQVWGYGLRTISYDDLGNQQTNGANSYTYDVATLRLATRTGNPTSGSYSYNAVGSTTSDPSASTFTHTAFQQLQTANVNVNGTWTETTYKYDGDGLRTFRRIGQAGEEHYFLHGPGSQLLAEYKRVNDTIVPVREYISLADRIIASIETTAETPASSCSMNFRGDDPVVANQTDIDADQIIDLRTAINCVRTWYGLGGFNWTDPILTENVTVISAAHVENLRTALNAAYAAAGYTAPQYDDPGPLADVPIRAIHVNQLRQFVRALPPPGPPPTTTTRYYHTDWLGSVRAITDANGGETRLEYFPFGEGTPLSGDPMRFTGKELDFESALHYFDARYYTAVDGRFTSADPYLDLDSAMVDPQHWNRYAYVLNNPLGFVDPEGLFVCTTYSSNSYVEVNCDTSDDEAFANQRRVLNSLQDVLDVASIAMDASGVLSPISWIPDSLNAVTSLVRRDWTGAATSGLAMVPFAGTTANAARLGKRSLSAFEKLGIRMNEHFVRRLAQRASRGITAEDALDAYRNGRLFYDSATGNFVRHSSRTGVSVITDAPSGGRPITVFEGRPSPSWNPVPWRPGR